MIMRKNSRYLMKLLPLALSLIVSQASFANSLPARHSIVGKVTYAVYIAYGNSGNEYYKQGDQVTAIRLFEMALRFGDRELVLHARLGHAYYQSGNIRKAADRYKSTLELADLTGHEVKSRDLMESVIRDAENLSTTLVVTTQPAGVKISTQQGAVLGISPLETHIKPGRYILHGELIGHETRTQTIDVRRGEQNTIEFLEFSPKQPEITIETEHEDESVAYTVIEWTSLGVGLASLGVGIFFNSEAIDDVELANRCFPEVICTNKQERALREDADEKMSFAIGFYVLGGLSLTAGIVMLLFDLTEDEPSDLHVIVRPSFYGVSYEASF